MASSRDVVVRDKRRVFDGFFKLDEITVSHRLSTGAMSADRKSLIFERGDSVAALIYNRDLAQVILVEQFKAPTLEKSRSNGFILEAMAGMIRPGETPDQAVAREAFEETGYRIYDPELIATFFSSPGGSSERIFLYFAVVTNADKAGPGGGSVTEGEDIQVVPLDVRELFDRLRGRALDDPKLIIATHFLNDWLRVEASRPVVLAPGTVTYRKRALPRLGLGIKTGEILKVRDVDVWVNSENTDMMMDRIIGRTISANIRYGGAEKDEEGNVGEDTIAEALRTALGRRAFVRIGTVVETTAGALAGFGVRRAGDGGLAVEQVAPTIVAAVDAFFDDHADTDLAQVFLLAFTDRDQYACQKAIRDGAGYEEVTEAPR
ncbi:MAG TPA: NUDIX hydrolase [Hyphomicrobiaceae bacterium]|jgi:ADP-ribose pyrophosphatase|nr:NUDIX hydrolase [Hyphomicrobiaceae bacterium]